jgi:hypothetical protein
MPFGLEARLVAPLRPPFLHLSVSVVPKLYITATEYVIEVAIPGCETYEGGPCDAHDSELRTTFSTAIRGGLSFLLGDWCEIRLDVAGMELYFGTALGVLYSPSFAVVLRI